jgi:hypothetical protein
MTRIKSFAAPHKGLRNIIAKFSLLTGYVEISDPLQLKALKDLGKELFTLLKDHVHTENEYTLKHLEERVKGASKHDKHDHEKLEQIQDALEQQLAHFSGTESSDEIHLFYLNFSLFQSQYLEHIYEEETITEKLLQENFTDEELMKHRVEIMKKLDFPILLLWLKYIVPAQNENESQAMLLGLKSAAPKDAFMQVLAVLKQEISEKRYNSLLSKL